MIRDPFSFSKAKPFTKEAEVAALTIPDANQIDVVANLEKDLRSEQQERKVVKQSEELGMGTGPVLPDIKDGVNKKLQDKVNKYAKLDPVKPAVSALGDFSNLLAMQADEPTQTSSIAQNQLMAMTYSTMFNTASQAERVIESQLTYNLAATGGSFGLNSLSEKNFKDALAKNKLLDGSFL